MTVQWITLTLLLLHEGRSWDCHNFDEWEEVAPICNEGHHQSPIDLRKDALGSNDGRPSLRLMNYTARPMEAKILNDGHSVELNGKWMNGAPSVAGTLVFSNEVYTFYNAHVHWSIFDHKGTEHSIRKQKYAAELHMVHYNQKYQNWTHAEDKPDGIMVVAVLYEVNHKVSPNPGMELVASHMKSILDPGDNIDVKSVDLTWFLPDPLHSFYSYSGSLTTPPCTENVHWVIISEPLPITPEIIQAFRSIELDNGDFENVRPLQSKNHRIVKFYHT